MTRVHGLVVKPGNCDISINNHKSSNLKKEKGKKNQNLNNRRMMKKQLTIVAALLILVALSSNLDMVAEAQLGPGDCYDGCSTACVQGDCEHPLLSSFTYTLLFTYMNPQRYTNSGD